MLYIFIYIYFKKHYMNQDFAQLKAQIPDGELFKDNLFPACDKSIG